MWSLCIELFTQRISSVSTGRGTESEKRENSGQELNRRLLREQKLNTEEISSLMKVPRAPLASGNGMRQRLRSFELLSPRSQLKHIYERAGFYQPVERSKCDLTRLDDDDGWV